MVETTNTNDVEIAAMNPFDDPAGQVHESTDPPPPSATHARQPIRLQHWSCDSFIAIPSKTMILGIPIAALIAVFATNAKYSRKPWQLMHRYTTHHLHLTKRDRFWGGVEHSITATGWMLVVTAAFYFLWKNMIQGVDRKYVAAMQTAQGDVAKVRRLNIWRHAWQYIGITSGCMVWWVVATVIYGTVWTISSLP